VDAGDPFFPLKRPRARDLLSASVDENTPPVPFPTPRDRRPVVRISGGAARGIPLVTPRGDATRPATDGMRQAVFSSLGAAVVGARFLDLFAGSGAYGLEALSRGAAGGVFVEQNAKAAACVRQNIAAVCKSLRRDARDLAVLQADARTVPLGPSAGRASVSANASVNASAGAAPPDLVFIDPPYEIIAEIAPALFARLAEALATKPDALVVFEAPGELDLAPIGWTLLKRLGKGARQPTVSFFRR
jgi:16S rRNA (guanine966-N2)-methyltransferase